MDETFGLGRGNYLTKHGLKDPAEIFLKHLDKVRQIANEIGFREVLLWSDMLTTLTFGRGYRDNITDIDKNNLPKILKDFDFNNINLVYWDYSTKEINLAKNILKNHQMLSNLVTFSSGFQIWQRLTIDLTVAKPVSDSAIEACRQQGVKDINFTLWNDNGGYCNQDDILIMLPHAAENIFELPKGTLTPLYEKLTKKNLKLQEEKI